jgi:hypothetical protein
MSTRPESALSFDGPNPKLADLVRAAGRDLSLELSVCFPATVSEVLDNGARVKVVPDHKPVLFTDDGEQVLEPLEIPDIPVWTYGQGEVDGGYLQFPVRVGAKGWVHVSDRSLDGWYENGLSAPAAGYHTHSPIDGHFVPGARDKTRALAQDDFAAVLEHTLIKIGVDAVQAAVLGDTMRAWAESLTAWATTHVHPVSGAATGVPAVPPPDVPSFLSTKVKIE